MTLIATGTENWIPTETNAINTTKQIIDKEINMHAFAPDIQSPPGIDPPDELADDLADELADEFADEFERVSSKSPVARCADGNGTMVGLFFSDHVVDIARAKAMCGLCPLAQQCLADALEREEPWGVWGGELLSGGRIIGDKRPCGRPPKNPRPPVVYDEMGPVGITLTSA